MLVAARLVAVASKEVGPDVPTMAVSAGAVEPQPASARLMNTAASAISATRQDVSLVFMGVQSSM
jgi:hypothetical protein